MSMFHNAVWSRFGIIMAMQKRYEQVRQQLQQYGQDHLLTFYDELDEAEKGSLLDQLEGQEWARLRNLIESHVLASPEPDLSQDIRPAPYYPHEPGSDLKPNYEQARQRGEDLLREGKVAPFTVAGGQGTRLGWDGPKGTFPATPLTGKTLFQVFAESILKTQRKFGATLPWYLMTSTLNDTETRTFFKENNYFGLEENDVTFFKQGSLPSIGMDGKVLLAHKGKLALNPDGHGGSLSALYRSGALDDMTRRGVEQISYFQVDNPNVICLDPLFIGLHALNGAQMSAKMLPKVGPQEKVGNFCLREGRTSVIEYSDMPAHLAEQRDENGDLAFNAGSIAIHMLSVDFVRALNEGEGGFALPYHRAVKKVPHIDLSSGERITPDKPNAVKLETFVFDALPLATKTVILEADRVEEFAPIKNAKGTDSPDTSRQLQSLRAARWLERNGVAVPLGETSLDAIIELSPLTAVAPEDLQGVDLPDKIEQGSEVLL